MQKRLKLKMLLLKKSKFLLKSIKLKGDLDKIPFFMLAFQGLRRKEFDS
jgi:hypothetical protein